MSTIEKIIRIAEVQDVDDIIELLNKVTLDLQEKEINQWKYPWDYEEIMRDIVGKNIYVLLLNGLIVGTFSIRKTDDESFKLMRFSSEYLYRIALLPEMQRKSLGSEIIEYAQKRAKSFYLDCWSGNEKLRQFYSSVGLNYIGDFPEKDYFVSVFKYELKE